MTRQPTTLIRRVAAWVLTEIERSLNLLLNITPVNAAEAWADCERGDVIGDKVVEINAESPGGMQSVERLYETDVCPAVIEALERRTGSKP